MSERLYTVYCEQGPEFRIDADGLVHVEDKTGGLVIHRVMAMQTFIRSLGLAQELVAKWRYDQMGIAEPDAPTQLVPKRKRKPVTH